MLLAFPKRKVRSKGVLMGFDCLSEREKKVALSMHN